jgi:diguanylate cyclase (GGDEF)-like protein
MSATRKFLKALAGHLRPHPFYLLVAFGSLFCVVVVVTTVWMVRTQYEAAIKGAGTNLTNLSQAVADQTDRIIKSVEIAEDRLLEHLALGRDDVTGERMGMAGSKQLHVVMRDIITGMSEAYALALLDMTGNLVNFSNEFPVPARNLADRPYFRFALAHPDVTSFISETVTSRQTSRPTFYVVRRITGPDGAFAGVLLGSVEVGYLERLFGASALPDGGSVALLRSDGTMLARYPAVAAAAAQGREAEFHTVFFAADHSPFRHLGVFDDADRMAAVSDLPTHPLKVAVSVPFVSVIAAWQLEAAWIGGVVALECLTTAITIFVTIRRFHDRQRLETAASALTVNEERRRAECEIAEQHARFGMALDNMSQGLMMFDSTRTLLLSNTAVLKIFDLQTGILRPGMPFTNVIRAIADVGNLSVNVATVIDFYLTLFEQNVPAKFTLAVPAGRHLTANFKPYDNGWLITFEDVTEVRRADERIMHMAMHDALTGLPNRVMLKTHTDEALAAIFGGGDSFAVMCLDLDNFKDINDTLGHPAGDRLLCEVAKRLQSVVRRSDLVARLGGDEFAIVAFPNDDEAGISELASRMVRVVGDPYEIDGHVVSIGTSIGIAMAPADGTAPDTLMKNADLALYNAKSNGRGRYAFFESSMEQHLADRRRVEVELRNALVLGEFELFYQPVVKVATRRIIGFEALMRWRHPTRGMVSPGEFIPIAEENGFIVQIGEWALNRACLEAARWPGSLRVAVNLSSVQFRTGNLVETVAGALAASGLAASRLELEITESTVMQDADATLAIIKEIKALGVRLAMDDFGTGYSSLAYLQRFPFDKVKIDRAFVRDSGQTTNLAIIRAVTSIAESMAIETTAEGVETEEQFACVANEGCTEVQGFLFSPPRPGSEILAMMAQQSRPAAAGVERVRDVAIV